MAATACHRSPQRQGGPFYTGACGKVEQPHPGRLRCHPACAVGGRRGTPPRRPPRRSPLVAHPRSATGNADQEPATPAAVPATRRTTTTSHDRQPPLPRSGAPSRIRSEPLKRRRITMPATCFAGPVAEPSADQGRLVRGGAGHLSGAALRHFGESRLGKEVRTTFGGCL
jgi:hypothetical protein